MLFNEPKLLKWRRSCACASPLRGFSALQRAEIAEIAVGIDPHVHPSAVSVLFNEPKLLKLRTRDKYRRAPERRFSALQRAEIAEIARCWCGARSADLFQCSSTSRNC